MKLPTVTSEIFVCFEMLNRLYSLWPFWETWNFISPHATMFFVPTRPSYTQSKGLMYRAGAVASALAHAANTKVQRIKTHLLFNFRYPILFL